MLSINVLKQHPCYKIALRNGTVLNCECEQCLWLNLCSAEVWEGIISNNHHTLLLAKVCQITL